MQRRKILLDAKLNSDLPECLMRSCFFGVEEKCRRLFKMAFPKMKERCCRRNRHKKFLDSLWLKKWTRENMNASRRGLSSYACGFLAQHKRRTKIRNGRWAHFKLEQDLNCSDSERAQNITHIGIEELESRHNCLVRGKRGKIERPNFSNVKLHQAKGIED